MAIQVGGQNVIDNSKNIVNVASYSGPGVASEAEATEGTNNNQLMTPLRVAQAIAALGGGGVVPTNSGVSCRVLVIGGGGGGGSGGATVPAGNYPSGTHRGGGGGAGGFVEQVGRGFKNGVTYPVTVGAAGANRSGPASQTGGNGGESRINDPSDPLGNAFGSLGDVVAGGGGGGGAGYPTFNGNSGGLYGSGGGGGAKSISGPQYTGRAMAGGSGGDPFFRETVLNGIDTFSSNGFFSAGDNAGGYGSPTSQGSYAGNGGSAFGDNGYSNISGSDYRYSLGGQGGSSPSNPGANGGYGHGGGGTISTGSNPTSSGPGVVYVSFPTSDYPTSKLSTSGAATITNIPGVRIYRWTSPGSFTVNA